MHKTISFKFETECFQVELDSESDPSILFLKFLNSLYYISSVEKASNNPGNLKLLIFSDHDEFISQQIKEKAHLLGLSVITSA